MADDELDRIRQRRLAELQARQQAAQQDSAIQAVAEQQAREEAEGQRDAILRQILAPEARQRLARLRMARPEEGRLVESQLIQLAQSGRLQGRIDDAQLKLLLARLLPSGRDISIRRK